MVVVTRRRATDNAAYRSGQLKKRFLEEYPKNWVIGDAAKATGIARQTFYDWLAADPQFVLDFEQAKKAVVERLEKEALRRAHQGVEEPVFYLGRECGTVRKYSDTLLIFLLKGNAPDKYRERLEHTGVGGGPIKTEVAATVNLASLSREELDALEKLLSKAADVAGS